MTTPPLRWLALLTLGLASCTGSGGGDAEAFCADLAASNEGCWNADLDAACRERHAECGDAIVVLESCPVQLACE